MLPQSPALGVSSEAQGKVKPCTIETRAVSEHDRGERTAVCPPVVLPTRFAQCPDAERVDGFGRQSTELSAQPRGVDAARKRGYRGSPSAEIEYRPRAAAGSSSRGPLAAGKPKDRGQACLGGREFIAIVIKSAIFYWTFWERKRFPRLLIYGGTADRAG